MEFEVLGPLQVSSRGASVRLSPKLAALLAALLCKPDVVIPEDQLIDVLWGEDPPRSATKSLQVYVHHLRQALGEGGRIERAAFGYRLAVPRAAVDARRFEDLAERGEQALESGDTAEGSALLRSALGLWRGTAFAGQDTLPLVREEAARLNEQRQRVAESWVDAELSLGRHSAVVAELRALVAEHPFRERLRAQLMIAYHRMGRSTEALEVFREGRDLLVDELGMEPGRELAALEQAVLRNDPALHGPAAADPPPEAPAPGAAPEGGPSAPADPSAAPGDPLPPAEPARPVPAQLPPDIADFTGREEQVALLHTRLGVRPATPSAPAAVPGPRPADGGGRGGAQDGGRASGGAAEPPATTPGTPGGGARPVVVSAVAGMGGVGKTALALHAAHTSAAAFPDGQLYANLRGAQEVPADPAQVLSQFLHALGIEGAAVPEPLEARAALFRSLLADRRMLVVLDDAGSEQQVRPLIPGAPGCAVLITSRARLTGLEGAHLIDLDVFEPERAVELLARIIGADRVAAEPGHAAEIVRLCGYAPLAVRIAGARLNARRQWPLSRLARLLGDEQRRLDELRTGDLGVRATFALSYAALSERGRSAFRLLGLLDAGDFTEWVAAALLDVPLPEAETVVEDLVDAQLLSISGTDGTGRLRYRMHDLMRLYARERCAEEVPRPDREAALRRAFGAWLWLAEQATEYIPGPCYATMHGTALRWPLPSPEAADLLNEPMSWFDAEAGAMAAAVTQACALGWDELAWDLAGCLEKYFDVRGRFDDWRRTHEAAIAACQAAGNVRGEAVLRRGLADLVTWTTQNTSGGASGAMGTLLDQSQLVWEMFHEVGDRRGMSDALVMRTWALVSQGDSAKARESAEAALDLAETADYLGGRARAYHVLAVAAHGEGRDDIAVTHLTKSLELARLLGNSRFEATAMQFLGAAQCQIGRVDEGRANLTRSLAMSRALGDHYAEVFSLLYLARLHRATNDPAALPTARTAAELSRRHNMNHHLADALTLMGGALLDQGRTVEAVSALEESVALWRTRGWPAFLADALTTLSRAYTALGDHTAATTAAQEAATIRADSPDTTRTE
ncbi:BTAD domain-containing putative transcriptional regulator [Streptomonospora nanhaiensis]|uniref:AfsR/SARP family transcriptional regulator n=1 Tax=Streptomonospora nanhaiensis TaxID=1323731 RepID=UPI001C38F005|nr:BTAD domain-containing putative transcriptional regulator [Streptomonospora nanhaiensis]MBV2363343.1 winged helix-turn-helix domain-containing protein [Streptomonospora nanhaiensis]MBX9388517.1 winged helix-turn-helix domain-containing protein [Streptomonospora nanhaiensis]